MLRGVERREARTLSAQDPTPSSSGPVGDADLIRIAAPHSLPALNFRWFHRTRCCLCECFGEALCLFGTDTKLRLHIFSLNSKNILEIFGLAQPTYEISCGGQVLLRVAFHFFS